MSVGSDDLCGSEKIERIDPEPVSDPLQRFQCQISLSTLKAAHVRAVDVDDLSEGFLAETAILPISLQILADGLLQVALHERNARGLLLERLQTDK